MSSRKHDAEQKPLMYIVQPDYDKAEANMQDILIKRKKKASPKLPNKKRGGRNSRMKPSGPTKKTELKRCLTMRRIDPKKESNRLKSRSAR